MPPERRDRHPYLMYEEIHLQPETVARSLQIVAESGADTIRVLSRARRVLLTGAGTSFNAAMVGAQALRRFTRGRVEAQAIEAYELVTYFPALRPDDVVVALTHSGETHMTLRALERARRAGAESVVITGFPGKEASSLAALTLPTGHAEERSWAHTAGYTAALTTLIALANALADPAEHLDLSPLPEVVRDTLGLEDLAHRLAAQIALYLHENARADLWLTGAGPNEATAGEGKLKLLETTYLPAAAFELEEMLHGPLAAASPATLLIVLAPTGPSIRRATDLVHAAEAIGIAPHVVTGEDSETLFPGAHRLLMPEIPEILTPIPYVIPLQLFAYFLSVALGRNPDLLRREEDSYRLARERYA
ncbi:MAG TPA: SIS domain-containing protein [Chloroflexota bacterium]|nr:SIS domain-containing protein [Chloroflexota bacterium]